MIAHLHSPVSDIVALKQNGHESGKRESVLEKDETELLELTESALSKLGRLSDEDFEKLELVPDFDA